MPKNEVIEGLALEEYKYDFRSDQKPVFRTELGWSINSTSCALAGSATSGSPLTW